MLGFICLTNPSLHYYNVTNPPCVSIDLCEFMTAGWFIVKFNFRFVLYLCSLFDYTAKQPPVNHTALINNTKIK